MCDEKTSEPNEHQIKLETLQSELEEMTEQAKRTMADFQNFKRRNEEERAEIFKMANESLLKGLLTPLDNFNRAQDEMSDGIKMAFEQLKAAMQNSGLEEINPEVGSAFDPELHEALLQGEGEQDTVLQVLEVGYKLGKKVLRHAKIKVGK